jgi:prepilin-type N-terminal cleavage/methylation domain-containing protein
MRKKRGFSLVEALLALALGGFALTAASSLLISLSSSWSRETPQKKVFQERCYNLKRLLREMVEESYGNIEVKEWPSNGDDPLICFTWDEPPPVFWSPLPGGSSQVKAFLLSDGFVLKIMWYSEIMRTGSGQDERIDPENIDDYNTITLSEDAQVTYFFKEEDGEWREESELIDENGKNALPDALTIEFESEFADPQVVHLYLKESLPTGPERESLF